MAIDRRIPHISSLAVSKNQGFKSNPRWHNRHIFSALTSCGSLVWSLHLYSQSVKLPSVLIQSASLSERAGSTIRNREELKYTFLCMGRGVNDMELIYSHSSLSISLILGLIDFGLTLSVVFPVPLVSRNFSLVVSL